MENTNQVSQLEQDIAALRAENERLKASATRPNRITFKVSGKGGVSAYGLGRFPVTLYGEQWFRLLAEADTLRDFLKVNESKLSTKPAK